MTRATDDRGTLTVFDREYSNMSVAPTSRQTAANDIAKWLTLGYVDA